jgi:hypothetical protein
MTKVTVVGVAPRRTFRGEHLGERVDDVDIRTSIPARYYN